MTTALRGRALLHDPLLNKGNAFPPEERYVLGLAGLLPQEQQTLEEQLARAIASIRIQETFLERYRGLTALQDGNATLFFRLMHDYLDELLPIISGAVLSQACQQYSHLSRRPRGLILSYPDRAHLDAIIAEHVHPDTALIVLSDGSDVLGAGDQGLGGMALADATCAHYTLLGGLHPATTLPIVLDLGTDNLALLRDRAYLGWRHERVRGPDLEAFLRQVIASIHRHVPTAIIHWEGLAEATTRVVLDLSDGSPRSIVGDVHGLGVTTLAGILAAGKATDTMLLDQRILIVGDGAAAHGIAELLHLGMVRHGLNSSVANILIWQLDRWGTLQHAPLAASAASPGPSESRWTASSLERQALSAAIEMVRPTVLIGVAGEGGLFTEEVVRAMAGYVAYPIILPLSSPASRSEADPALLLSWTKGRAIVAIGGPGHPVWGDRRRHVIGQAAPGLLLPGLVQGCLATRARQITDGMLLAAADALSAAAPINQDPHAPLYPELHTARTVAPQIAEAVGYAAQREGAAEPLDSTLLRERIAALAWIPRYPRLQPTEGSPPA